MKANRMVPILQEVTSCGPEKEDCIRNQTLRDKSCLVPCTGLYADFKDDSLTQAMRKGKCCSFPCWIFIYDSDLQALTEEIYDGVKHWEEGSQERLHAVLQQMLPTSADDEVDDVKSLTESYHKYKREYVKHLGFNPKNKNLCKWSLNYQRKSIY